jgi:hypothetical protein
MENETQETPATPAPESAAPLLGSPAPASSWRDGISEEIAGHSSLSDLNSVEDLAKATIHAQQMVGADKIAIPTKESEQSVWDEVYSKLGRPSNSEDYELPEGAIPPDTKFESEAMGRLKSEAHRLGLNKQQFAGLARYLANQSVDHQQNQAEIRQQSMQESVAQLQQEFGAAYTQNIGFAQDAVKRFGGEQLVQELDSTGMGNNPALVKAFAQIGRMIAEDEIIGGGGGQSFTKSPEEAQKEIQELQLDPEFMAAYMQSHNPGHKAALDKMQKLYELAHHGS